MLGNVWEWCADDMRKYEAGAVTDPMGALSGAERALRGGSWNYSARRVRAALRNASGRDDRYNAFGFRCARVQSEEPVRAERETAKLAENESLFAKLQIAIEALAKIADLKSREPFETAACALKQIEAVK